MGLRFRKSIRLAPGVRLNLGLRGASLSVGGRGASVTFGSRGASASVGIPGTGLSYQRRLGGGGSRNARATGGGHQAASHISIGDDGAPVFQDSAGQPLSAAAIRVARAQHADAIRELVQQRCDAINAAITALGDVHHATPPPHQRPEYTPRGFPEPPPQPPNPSRAGCLLGWLPGEAERRAAADATAQSAYESQLIDWDRARQSFELAESRRERLITHDIYHDIEAMDDALAQALQAIEWPRETLIASEIDRGGQLVFLDVDLPEIEDMPRQRAMVAPRGDAVAMRAQSATDIQQLYVRHIHAVLFRIIGETFAALPLAQQVVISGFSQRPQRATGSIQDEYLISARVTRERWGQVAQHPPSALDVVAALEQCALRRSLTTTGRLRAIVPYAPGDADLAAS
jgi:hypothetical protein